MTNAPRTGTVEGRPAPLAEVDVLQAVPFLPAAPFERIPQEAAHVSSSLPHPQSTAQEHREGQHDPDGQEPEHGMVQHQPGQFSEHVADSTGLAITQSPDPRRPAPQIEARQDRQNTDDDPNFQ
jgi:hypothetical protein